MCPGVEVSIDKNEGENEVRTVTRANVPPAEWPIATIFSLLTCIPFSSMIAGSCF
jgi:hypothetical protein